MTVPSASDYKAQVLPLFEGDEALLCEVVQLFLDDSPQTLAALREAVAERNGKKIHQFAHTLKGSISNFLLPAESARGGDPARTAAEAALAVEQIGVAAQWEKLDEAFAALQAAMMNLQQRLHALLPV
jgi:HPt (histidine-containing phosphotransfer) domain-containing protein